MPHLHIFFIDSGSYKPTLVIRISYGKVMNHKILQSKSIVEKTLKVYI